MARLAETVDLPTPPLPLATATTYFDVRQQTRRLRHLGRRVALLRRLHVQLHLHRRHAVDAADGIFRRGAHLLGILGVVGRHLQRARHRAAVDVERPHEAERHDVAAHAGIANGAKSVPDLAFEVSGHISIFPYRCMPTPCWLPGGSRGSDTAEEVGEAARQEKGRVGSRRVVRIAGLPVARGRTSPSLRTNLRTTTGIPMTSETTVDAVVEAEVAAGEPWSRERFVRWLTRYDPLLPLFSAPCVLVGVWLIAGGLGAENWLRGKLWLHATTQLYEFCLLGGAAVLLWSRPPCTSWPRRSPFSSVLPRRVRSG